jgi:hypothetical protein
MIQKVWDSVQTVQHNREIAILKSLRHIQASIMGLEQKHKDIQAKAAANTEIILNKVNEIEATTACIKNKYKAMEHMVKEAPKTCADITKASTTNTKEKEITEMHVQQRQQHDALQQEVKEQINAMAPKEITERCQQAIENASILSIKLQGVNKLARGIHVCCVTEEQARQLHAIDWSEVFEGIKTHKSNYGIVIHGMLLDDLDLEDLKTIRLLKVANGFSSETIIKVTFL